MVRMSEGNEIVHIVRMNFSAVNKLAQPAGKGVHAIADGPVLRTDPYDVIMVLGNVDPQDLMIRMADILAVRGDHDDKGRNPVLPHDTDRRDIYNFPKGIIVTERLIFLLIPDSQKGTVGTGVAPQLMAGDSLPDFGRYLPYAFIVVKNFMIVFPYDKNSGGRQ